MRNKALRIMNKAWLLATGLLLAGSLAIGQYTGTQIAGGATLTPTYPATAATASPLEIGAAGPMAVAPNGDIAWADYYNGGLIYWDASEDELYSLVARDAETSGIGGQASGATVGDRILGVAFDSQSNVYISADFRVLKVDMTSGVISLVAGAGINPGGSSSAGPVDVSVPLDEMVFHAAGLVFNDDDTKLFVNALNNNQVLELDLVSETARVLMGTGVRGDDGTTGLGYEKDTREPFGIDYVKDPATGIEWLYVCTQQKRVHKFNLQTGIRSLLAGNGGWGYGGDDGLAVNAMLKQPHDISVDPNNTAVYFGDHQAHVVRKVDLKSGIITKFAGTNVQDVENTLAGNDGPADQAILNRPIGTDFDPDGNMIITERTSQLIRKVDMSTNIISLVTGGAAAPVAPVPSDGLQGTQLAVNARGVVAWGTDVYFFDNNTKVIVKLADDGTTSVYAGVEGESGFNGGGDIDTAHFGEINEMILDSNGDIFAADRGHDVIYKIDVSEGSVSVVAGIGGQAGWIAENDGGPAIEQKLKDPEGIAFNADESKLYINDRSNYVVQVVDMGTGNISLYAGVPGSRGEVTAETALLEAQFRDNRGIAVDADGNVYVGSSRYHKIYKMDGTNASVFASGFSAPLDLLFAAGSIWVSDNGTVKIVDPATGAVETVNNDVPGSYSLWPGTAAIYVTGQANGVYEMTADPAGTLAMIQGYADANDAAALTLDMLDELGAGTIEFNLDAYKAAVADSTAATLPYNSSVQALVSDVNKEQSDAVIAAIDGFAAANDASALELFHLAITGMNNVVDANLQDYRDVIEIPDTTGVADVAALQAIINQGNINAALAVISAMAAADDASDLSYTLMEEAGGTGMVLHPDYLAMYKDSVAAEDAIATVAELQAVIDAVNTGAEAALANAALTAINAMAVANDASDLSFEMIQQAGADMSAVNFDYLDFYKEGVADSSAVADVAALDALIAAANAEAATTLAADALAAIDAMAAADDASGLTRQMLEDAGATNLKGDLMHFEKYQELIAAATGVADLAALQAIIDAANLELAIDKIEAYAEADDASGMSGDELVAAGVDFATVFAYNLTAYQDSVAAAAATDVDATAKIQALVDEVNAAETADALAAIDAMAVASDASTLTEDMLKKAGAQDVNWAYEAALKAAIAEATGVADLAALQTIVDQVNTCEEVRLMAGTADAAELTIAHLTALGVANVFDVALEAYQDAIFTADTIENCGASLQALIDAGNLAFVLAMAENDDASDLTADMLTAVGVTGIDPALIDDYKTAIEDADPLADLAALQAVIDAVGVEDFSIEGISVYPNPNSGIFTVSLNTEGVSMSIVDITGRVVLSRELTDLVNTVDLSGESKGLYFVKLSKENEVLISKLVIE